MLPNAAIAAPFGGRERLKKVINAVLRKTADSMGGNGGATAWKVQGGIRVFSTYTRTWV